MVEDEFLATARAFTAHLHHAEYLRLKNAAKARSEKAGIGIERPVDGVTAMRAETRKRKEAEAREKKVRGVVDGIVAVSGEGRRGSDGEEEGSDFEEGERHDDPWQGTQLQHFMTKSPKKAGMGMGVGLTGLQGVVSHTRAAAGFRKWEKKKDGGRGGSPTATRTRGGDREEEEEEDEDTDDLDLPTYPHRHHHPPPPTLTNTKTKTVSNPSQPLKHPPPPRRKPTPKPNPPPRAFLDITPPPKRPPPHLPQTAQPVIKKEADLGKFESVGRDRDGDKGDISRGIRERAEARRKRRGRGREGGREGVGDEIPVFLV